MRRQRNVQFRRINFADCGRYGTPNRPPQFNCSLHYYRYQTGKASGVAFVDRVTHVEGEAFAKVIIVAASTRNRLASCSIQSRNIIPRAWGTAQEFWDITSSIILEVLARPGFFPVLAGRDPINEDGKATGIFIPRFRNLDAASKQKKFIRGYGFECGSATSMFPGMARRAISGFGAEYKKQVTLYTAPVGMTV